MLGTRRSRIDCVRWGLQPPSLTLHCSFQKSLKGPVCILLYVDDLVVTGPDFAEISQVKSQLSDAFEMKDLGDLHYFLGIEVIHTPDDILLSQRHYVLNML